MIGRPPKEGIDYSGWDVSILDNDEKIDKLIDAQGIGAFTIYFYLCQKVYATKGYYLIWSYSLCATIARKLGRGASAEYVKNVVDVCFQSGLFDKRLFELHGILTSRGIQKRYWAVAKDRRAVAIISEYWLLDEEESPSFYNRAQKSNYDPSKLNYDPSKSHKSKGNESKGNKKRDISDDISTQAEETIPSKKRKYGEYHHVLLSGDEYEKLTEKLGADMRDICIEYLDSYIEEKGYKSKSHYLSITRWVVNAVEEREKRQANIQRQGKGGESGTDNVFMQIYEERYGEKHDK